VKDVSKEVDKIKKVEEKKPEEKKKEDPVKKKDKKKPGEKKVKKTEAIVNGRDLSLSTKQCIAICNFIRGKTIDKAISQLGEVLEMKRAIPMKGEIPHRKGKGMEIGSRGGIDHPASGRRGNYNGGHPRLAGCQ